jgi:phosphohistidine phosphatase
MLTLHLLRHAKSSWDDDTLADHERPLAPRGERDAHRVAEHLSASGVAPDLVLCSSSVRTRQTLELIRPALGDPPVEIDEALYAASAEGLLERLRSVPESAGCVLLVGHNPGLQDLALGLAAGGPRLAQMAAKFPTGAVATLAVQVASWSELDDGGAELTGFVVPKQLA